MNVSLLPAVNVTTPDELVVPTNCLRTVNCVSLTPLLVSVKRVLIVFFGNLNSATFFSGLFNLATLKSSKPKTSLASTVASFTVPDSKIILSPASPLLELVPSRIICPVSPVSSRTKSAVKSCPPSSSSIKTCLASENLLVIILDAAEPIVISVLPEFSISLPVSAESDAINFSPVVKEPITFVSVIVVPDVREPNTNPVAPEVAPLIWTPPLVWVAMRVGLGISLIVKVVNILTSKRNNLYCAVWSPGTPESNSIALALATPTWLPEAEPLVEVLVSNIPTVLYAVDSPDIWDTSGVPYRLSTFAKFPNSKVAILALTVSNSLAFNISRSVGTIFSISKPFTNALPDDTRRVSKDSLTGAFPSVLVLPWKIPLFVLPLKSLSIHSFIENWKGLTV